MNEFVPLRNKHAKLLVVLRASKRVKVAWRGTRHVKINEFGILKLTMKYSERN